MNESNISYTCKICIETSGWSPRWLHIENIENHIEKEHSEESEKAKKENWFSETPLGEFILIHFPEVF